MYFRGSQRHVYIAVRTIEYDRNMEPSRNNIPFYSTVSYLQSCTGGRFHPRSIWIDTSRKNAERIEAGGRSSGSGYGYIIRITPNSNAINHINTCTSNKLAENTHLDAVLVIIFAFWFNDAVGPTQFLWNSITERVLFSLTAPETAKPLTVFIRIFTAHVHKTSIPSFLFGKLQHERSGRRRRRIRKWE